MDETAHTALARQMSSTVAGAQAEGAERQTGGAQEPVKIVARPSARVPSQVKLQQAVEDTEI